MKISVGKSRRDVRWHVTETSWEELSIKLGSFHRTFETMRDYKAMTKDEQSLVKDVGGFVGGVIDGGRRTAVNVKNRCLITLDADNATADLPDDAGLMIDQYSYVIYSTHSHYCGHERYRFVLPLSRPVSPDEYIAVARKIAQKIGIEAMDPTTYQPERLMYWPSCPVDAEPFYRLNRGVPVDPDAILSEYGENDAWRDTRLWPIAKAEQEIQLREHTKQGDPREKPGLIGAFCRMYDIHDAIERFLSHVYTPCDDGVRYTYIEGSTSAGAVVYDDARFLYSNHATDPACGQLLNSFDLVRVHLYGAMDEGKKTTDTQKLPSYAAMRDFAANLPEIKRQWVDAATASVDDLLEANGANGADSGDGAEDDNAWADELVINTKTGKPEDTIANALLLMSHAPELRGVLAYDQLKASIVKLKRAPWDTHEYDPDHNKWTDADLSGLYLHMSRHYGLTNRGNINDALTLAVRNKTFHPVQDYLKSLVWDGVPRVDTLLVDHMAAEDSPYVRAVTRKWMCGAVARAMRPGCKFDNMLVLTGPQGIGKSRLMSILSRGWFSDSVTRMDGSKESYESLDGAWIVEIAELAAFKRADGESLKNFVSKTSDSYRKAYARTTEEYPRRCVFYGTTNDAEFLRDRTGARRFWPVHVAGIEHGVLRGLTDAVVDQLWAEAVSRWRDGESLWLDDESLQEAASAEQAMFTAQDEMVGIIEEFLDVRLPEDWYARDVDDRRSWFSNGMKDLEPGSVARTSVCVPEIRCECFGERKEDIGRNDITSRRIANVLNNLPGWAKKGSTRVRGYGVQQGYMREFVGYPRR